MIFIHQDTNQAGRMTKGNLSEESEFALFTLLLKPNIVCQRSFSTINYVIKVL